jgi:hypothetical protein
MRLTCISKRWVHIDLTGGGGSTRIGVGGIRAESVVVGGILLLGGPWGNMA